MTRRATLTNAGHVQEGKNRFPKARQLDAFTSEDETALWHRLEFFPTPPWAVRALFVTGALSEFLTVLEPAAGRGHIVEPLTQLGFTVIAHDIHDYGKGYGVKDFLAKGGGTLVDAVITNPPFSLAADFVRRGLELAPDVFILCRLSFLCTGDRHSLHVNNLEAVYPFCERVCMQLGGYNPKAKFATEVAWFHFKRDTDDLSHPAVIHIPPGTRDRLFRPDDVKI